MQGSRDFENMPRVEGTHIVGYRQSKFDAGQFVQVASDRTLQVSRPEGQRTRIIYVGQEDHSTLQLLRNYMAIFSKYGDYNEVYSCIDQDCPPRFGCRYRVE